MTESSFQGGVLWKNSASRMNSLVPRGLKAESQAKMAKSTQTGLLKNAAAIVQRELPLAAADAGDPAVVVPVDSEVEAAAVVEAAVVAVAVAVAVAVEEEVAVAVVDAKQADQYRLGQ